MRVGHTQQMIEEIGLYLETHPEADVLLAAATMRNADYIMRRVIPRVQWKRKLRDGMRINRSRYEVIFGSGARLRVVSARTHRHRGIRVDKVYIEDRVLDDPDAHDVLNSLRWCEWPTSYRRRSDR